jgi:hypothetical protein
MKNKDHPQCSALQVVLRHGHDRRRRRHKSIHTITSVACMVSLYNSALSKTVKNRREWGSH